MAEEYEGTYYGNRKNKGGNHLFAPYKEEDFMTAGIRGKGGGWAYGQEPKFDSGAYARANAAAAATGSWMRNIPTDTNARRKAAEPMKKLAEAGLSFEEINGISKRIGRDVIDSDNDVDKVLAEYNRMHNIGQDKDKDKDKGDDGPTYSPPPEDSEELKQKRKDVAEWETHFGAKDSPYGRTAASLDDAQAKTSSGGSSSTSVYGRKSPASAANASKFLDKYKKDFFQDKAALMPEI